MHRIVFFVALALGAACQPPPEDAVAPPDVGPRIMEGPPEVDASSTQTPDDPNDAGVDPREPDDEDGDLDASVLPIPPSDRECPNLPSDVPATRPVELYEHAVYNYFWLWHAKPDEYEEWFDEMSLMSPRVIGSFGFHLNVLNPIQWGPVLGLDGTTGAESPEAEADHATYGDFMSGSAPALAVDAGRASPEILAERWAALREWASEFDDDVRLTPYMDFYTTVYGNREDRVGGLWELWNHWDEYAAPNGPFDLGERPPRPEDWLLQLWDVNYNEYPAYPQIAGLSFPGYSAKSQIQDQDYFRYRYSIASDGWAVWFRQVMRHLAGIGYGATMVDNVNFRHCWNPECQQGFVEWVETNYGAGTAERVLTHTTSLLANHNFESVTELKEGVWNENWFQRYHDGGPGRVVPDFDSYYGLYSARLEGEVGFRIYQTADFDAFPEEDFRVTIHYRMRGLEDGVTPEVTLTQKHTGAPVEMAPGRFVDQVPLPPSSEWTSMTYTVRIPRRCYCGTQLCLASDAACQQLVSRNSNELIIRSDGAADVLIDEIWFTQIQSNDDGTRTDAHPTFQHGLVHEDGSSWELPFRFRRWASGRYWDSLIDEKISYLRAMAREVDPEFELLTNSYFPRRGSDMFVIEGQTYEFEASRQDTGSTPGLYRATGTAEDRTIRGAPVLSDIVMSNEFDYKASHARRFPDFFSYALHMSNVTAPGYLHNRDSITLLLAETAAFGGGAIADVGVGYSYFSRYPDSEVRRSLRERARDLRDFAAEQSHLYSCLRHTSEVGIAFHDFGFGTTFEQHPHQVRDLTNYLSEEGIPWDLLPTSESVTAERLARLRVVLYHQVDRLPREEVIALRGFVEQGGVLVLSGQVGVFDEMQRLHAARVEPIWPLVEPTAGATTRSLGRGFVVQIPRGITPSEFAALVEDHLGRSPRIASTGDERLGRLHVATWTNAARTVVHFVNYDVLLGADQGGNVRAREDIQVSLPLHGAVPERIRLWTPEPDLSSDGEVPFTVGEDGIVRFIVPRVNIYAIAEVVHAPD